MDFVNLFACNLFIVPRAPIIIDIIGRFKVTYFFQFQHPDIYFLLFLIDTLLSQCQYHIYVMTFFVYSLQSSVSAPLAFISL